MFRLGDWSVDPATRRLSRSDQVARLSPKAMDVLSALQEAQGQVLSRSALLEAVWPDVTVGEEVLTHAVAEIRKALGDSTREPRYVETVPKRGYRLLIEPPAALPATLSAVSPPPGTPEMSFEAVRPVRRGARLESDKPSIAVLAFDNLSGDPEQEYFATGMTEDIITDLSRFRSLAVIARHSSFSFKGQPIIAQQVGQTLGVDYVVEGSLRRAGITLRVNAQMIDAASGQHIWAERYDRDLEDIFAVQDEVVRSIVAALRNRVEGIGLARSQGKGTDSLSAYEHVLRGRIHYDKMTAAEDLKALGNFERAIEVDPSYALAHACLARVYMDAFLFAWAREPEAALERALELAKTAVALDETESFAHASLATALLYKKEHRRAEKAFDQAVALNPNDACTLVLRGFLSEALGQADEALTWIDRALRLNPFAPDWYLWQRARSLFLAQDYAQVAATAEEIEQPPYEVLGLVAASHAWLGAANAAREALARFHEAAAAGMASYPGDDAEGWRRYWSNGFPYQDEADLTHLLGGLRRAGLAV